MLRLLALILLLAPAGVAQTCKPIPVGATDGVLVAPEFHKVIYEDQDVRVLAVTNPPHTREEMHTHARPSVFIMLEDHPFLMFGPDASKKPRRVAAKGHPYAFYLPPEPPHAIENDGDFTIRAIRIELKHPGCGPAPAPLGPQDALLAAPANHNLIFENGDVRVLSVTVPPHSREPMHTHAWPSIAYLDTPGNIRYFTPADPTPEVRTARQGLVRLPPEGLHAVENLGDTPFHLFRVELKRALPAASANSQ